MHRGPFNPKGFVPLASYASLFAFGLLCYQFSRIYTNIPLQIQTLHDTIRFFFVDQGKNVYLWPFSYRLDQRWTSFKLQIKSKLFELKIEIKCFSSFELSIDLNWSSSISSVQFMVLNRRDLFLFWKMQVEKRSMFPLKTTSDTWQYSICGRPFFYI